MQYRVHWFFFVFNIVLNLPGAPAEAASLKFPSDSNKLPIGIWRGEIRRTDGNTIPFNFQTRVSAGKIVMYVINGSERLLVDKIHQKGDSVFIDMPFLIPVLPYGFWMNGNCRESG